MLSFNSKPYGGKSQVASNFKSLIFVGWLQVCTVFEGGRKCDLIGIR